MQRKNKNILLIIILVLVVACTVFTIYYAKNNLVNVANNESGQDMGAPNNSEMGEPPEKPSGDSSTMEEPKEMPNGSMIGSPNTESVSLTTIYYVIFGVESLIISIIVLYLLLSRFNQKTFKGTFISKDKALIYIMATILLTLLFTAGFSVFTNKVVLVNSNADNNSENNNGNSSVTYSGVKEITSDEEITSGSYESTNADENAILVNGNIAVSLTDIIVSKTGDSDGGDSTSFYGINSAIIAKGGANLIIKNATITTSATGANGVFSYGGSATTSNSSGDGTIITISDSTINTTGDNAGGIMTTGGGITDASNLIINTSGTSSAAIRSDRGGGTVNVDGGTYTTIGNGSPTIYSTADINVSNATLTAKASEGIVIEGKNSVTISNCILTDSNTKLNGQSTTYKNIFLYQSMSGDADTGNATFNAKNSNITTNNGDTLYVTNTAATITLENNTITNKDGTGNFLRIQKDSWGTSGSNGGTVILNLISQNANGNIVVDSISTLDMTLKTKSYFEGTINSNNDAKEINIVLDSTSTIKLTGNSYINSLEDDDSSYSNINFNGYKLYVNGTAIN